MKRIARSALVGYRADEIYALVEDIESYPRFLPWCREARVLERGPAGTRATLTAGFGALRQQFTTRNENQPGRAIDMRLVEGPFRHFAAAWRFEPLAEQGCRVEFAMEYEFASRTVGRLLQPLFDGIADTMMDAFLRRADQVYGGRGR